MIDTRRRVRLLCAPHTCGITRVQVPDRFFYNFYGAADAEIGLTRRRETVLTLGLNIWVSIPEAGPRDYVCWVPVSWSFEVGGRLRQMTGRWVAVQGRVEVQVVDLRGEEADRVCTRVLRGNLRAWCRQQLREDGSLVLSRGGAGARLGRVIPIIYCYPEPRSDVSVVAVNLFVSHCLPLLEGHVPSGGDEGEFVNHDWEPEP